MNTPTVVIAMAMYRPNLRWLEEQLQSLNNQDYDNLKLLVWNDCPTESNHEEVFRKSVTRFPYKIIKGNQNLGSNGAFEALTRLADSEYIAYCDQDDIWVPNKIRVLVECLETMKSDLVCSDMYVVDENSNLTAKSIVEVRPRQKFYEGKNLFKYFLTKNFVTGCTTLVKTSIAKKALPFPKYTVHDWWLGLYVSAYGSISVIKLPLIKYRIHRDNQTSSLKGISNKTDYYHKYICYYTNKIGEISTRFNMTKFEQEIKPFVKWAGLREKNYNQFSAFNIAALYAMRTCNEKITLFEIILKFLPDKLFILLLKQIKSGNI